MPLYELTEDADADVEEIVRYTLGEWGEEQAGQYAEKLHRHFEKIARKEIVARAFSRKYSSARGLADLLNVVQFAGQLQYADLVVDEAIWIRHGCLVWRPSGL